MTCPRSSPRSPSAGSARTSSRAASGPPPDARGHPERPDHARGDRQDPGRPARRGPGGGRGPTAPLDRHRIARGSRGARRDRARRRGAAGRRALPAQPGRRAGDAGRAGGRRRRLQVRHDRDRDLAGHRARRRGRAGRPSPSPRHPPARRVAARGRRRLARSGPAVAGRRRAVARLHRLVRHPRCGRRLPGPSARRALAGTRAVRPRDPRAARGDPARSATGTPGHRARTRPGRTRWLARGERPPRPRPRRPAGHPRRRDDRADPARLYGARHPIHTLAPGGRRPPDLTATRVEGPICESTDSLGIHDLPALRRGDLVAIADAGAYAASQGSTYNGRPRPPQVLLAADGTLTLGRRRGSI